MVKILVPLAQGLEEIEAISIIDILRRGGVEVVSVGLDSLEITGSHKITIIADKLLQDISSHDFDGIVLPGGMPGTLHLKNNPKIISIIQKMYRENKLIGAICAAPMVLEKAGILEEKNFTIHPAVKDDISLIPKNLQFVKDGNIITGQASGAVTLFTLQIIKIIFGKEKMNEVNNGVLFKI